MILKKLLILLFFLTLLLVLNACGGGGGSTPAATPSTPSTAQKVTVTFALQGAPDTIYSADLDVVLPDGFALETDSLNQPTASALSFLVIDATAVVNYLPATTANGEVIVGIIKSDGFSGDASLMQIVCVYPAGATLPTADDFIVTAFASDSAGVDLSGISAQLSVTTEAVP
ncbi:MAG: hypothetical protein CVU69_06405 [Deltaproteobacteria bacterium HGW-Deltaproteobacteria-4]|nr:MAG: hypothetical protein CVU69_06405 [Deltaproteobacteria bacterium HGW-Deltaproteobacteria-4]